MISAVVLTKNEEKNIGDCLNGLSWCDEIIVIDDGSGDKTIEIAKKHQAIVFKHELNKDFGSQRNYGLEKAKGDWILFVDADERVSKELEEEIKEKIKVIRGVNGYFFRRIDFFINTWLKHGEIGKVRILRLARKDTGKWRRKVDEIWEVKGETKVLSSPLLHYSHDSLNQFIDTINERSTLNAKQLFEEKKNNSLLDWFKPAGKFVFNYFFLLGFLDGIAGFVFAFLMSFHSFLVRGKLYLLDKNNKNKKDPPSSRQCWDYGRASQEGKIGGLQKIIFLIWTGFVFFSYLLFLYQRGMLRWSK